MSEVSHAEFVRKFSDFWAAPQADRMSEILADDVLLIQPLSNPMEGLSVAQDEFSRLFRWIPDLHGETRHWGANGDILLIEFTLHGTLGRSTKLAWPCVDRFVLVGGKASKRVTYFDTGPLIWALIKTPSAWWSWWRSGTARPWRR